MKILIAILLILSSYSSYSKTRDLNIYGTFPGYTYSFEFDLEYSILNFDLLGTESTTYLKYGSSMFGIQGASFRYSVPIIGLVQYIGTEDGVDIGASYFKTRTIGTDRNLENKPIYKEEEDFLGFEVGYRNYFSDNAVFRFTFTPSYSLDDPPKDVSFLKYFQYMLSVSVGYSF
ncbi:hypothetical protein EP342_01010 [bacterium]|nr:MAG: hypothetical protein EP342_01010 [bacterium]